MDELADVLQFDPLWRWSCTGLPSKTRLAYGDGFSPVPCATEQAAECECETPLPKRTKGAEPGAATCGHQQAEVVAGVNIQVRRRSSSCILFPEIF